MTVAVGRVLVVDDDVLMRTLASGALRHAGFDVTEAAGGADALAAFEAAPFDVLLLDVVMPDMDGYEVCARLRALPQGERVQVLMLTGLNDTESIELSYRAGASDFIAKPINWSLLSHRVRYAMRAGTAVDAERRLRESLERAQRLAHLGHWEMALDDGALNCSPELQRIVGGVPGDAAAFLALIDDADRARVQAARDAALRDAAPYQLQYVVRRADGGCRTVYEQAGPVLDAGGRAVAIEGITQDISERLEAEQRIRDLAHYDPLTGLPNRQFFNELVMPALQLARRQDRRCALIHVDLDRFKTVNDALGHAGGDAVLRTIAERVQSVIRASDVAAVGAGESIVARVGANAFTLLLVDIGSDQHAARVAQRVLDVIADPLQVDGRDFVLTASLGVALFPRDGREVAELTRGAEQALYAAKAAGRKQYRFFDEAMHAAASAQLQRESDLRRAIAEGQLRLHYQPKVDAESGQIVGAEALVRWQHPLRGLVPPGEFIPLAEQSGLILPLTDWVLESACTDLRRRHDAGLAPVPVSVNLASPSFMQDDLLERLDGLMRRHGLSPSSLMLEVTESMLMIDVERAVQRLDALHQAGYVLSLDDFGTGYSSLNYLKRFPIDELKIDRSFVADVAAGGRDSALAASIIALARGLGLSVVAEGVETGAQSSFLVAHGCATHQGYLFARPMPPEAFDALLARGRVDKPAPAQSAVSVPRKV